MQKCRLIALVSRQIKIRIQRDHEKSEAWKLTKNPLQCEVAYVVNEVQEEFVEFKCNSTAEENFKVLDPETCWVKQPLISHEALRFRLCVLIHASL